MSLARVWAGVRFFARTMIKSNLLAGSVWDWLAVSAIFLDVPDREDAFFCSDADLDVVFFTDPAPLVDPLHRRSWQEHASSGVNGFFCFTHFIIQEIEHGTIQRSVAANIPREGAIGLLSARNQQIVKLLKNLNVS